eukprot:RCo026555
MSHCPTYPRSLSYLKSESETDVDDGFGAAKPQILCSESVGFKPECLNHVVSPRDLGFSADGDLRISPNPFKMYFPGTLEKEYRDWAHMHYIPCRGWILLSAFLAELDIFTYGMLS